MRIYFFLILSFIINKYKIFNLNNKLSNKEKYEINGIYKISSFINGLYFSFDKYRLILSNKIRFFHIIKVRTNTYYIKSRLLNMFIGINEENNIILYNKTQTMEQTKLQWNIILINDNQFIIENKFNNKFIQINNTLIKCTNNLTQYKKTRNISDIDINCIFNYLKLFDIYINIDKDLKIIRREPIDLVIKYIDLCDVSLNRTGIKQIYKDKDNEELRYSIRSILENLPWIRKIFIIMPNNKVKYFKLKDIIKDKIIYIKDKDILGFDSANIYAFTFQLYRMEKFGLSKNFIYMEDDFFIGKLLKKSDFFYYDQINKKVLPFILTTNFYELNKTETLNEYNKLYKIKESIHPHSGIGWNFSLLNTEKFFIDRYNKTLINTKITHNAKGENIDDLKEIYSIIQNYQYINETLFSIERNILTLNQPHFVNLYQLNIKKKKVHSLSWKYIEIEKLKIANLYKFCFFVINTGGNHMPSKRQYNLQKILMNKRFPLKTKYEIEDNHNLQFACLVKIKPLIFVLKSFIIIILLKLDFSYLINIINYSKY